MSRKKLAVILPVIAALLVVILLLVPGGRSYVAIDIDTTHALPHPFLGLGVEWDPMLWLPPNRIEEEDWELIVRRIQHLRPDLIRMYFYPPWWEEEQGRPTPDSPGMRGLYRYLEVCEKLELPVLLTVWGRLPDWLRDGEGNLTDSGAFAQLIASALAHLLKRGFSVIKYLSVYNEPNYEFAGSKEAYREMYAAVNDALEAGGIKGVTLTAPGESGARDWFEYAAGHMDELVGAFAFHVYAPSSIFDTGQLAQWVEQRALALKTLDRDGVREPLLITEAGLADSMSTFENPLLERDDYGVFMAELALTALSHGASAVLLWCLHDVYYGTEGGKLMKWGLWRYRDQGWRPRPSYYAWSLLTRYTVRGSRIIPVEAGPEGRTGQAARPEKAGRLRLLALESPGGALTVIAVNRSPEPAGVEFQLRDRDCLPLRRYEYSRSTLARLAGDELPAGGETACDGAAFRDLLPANSLVVYTDVKPPP